MAKSGIVAQLEETLLSSRNRRRSLGMSRRRTSSTTGAGDKIQAEPTPGARNSDPRRRHLQPVLRQQGAVSISVISWRSSVSATAVIIARQAITSSATGARDASHGSETLVTSADGA